MLISFCTTCKGRLHHLRRTLLHNLTRTAGSIGREFVILNYGSRDNLDGWAKENLSIWIKQGLVNYYHTAAPAFYISTHAKNVAHKLAKGEILVNVDADAYLPTGFPEHLAALFRPGERIIVGSYDRDRLGSHGSCGLIAVRREDFYSVQGYDEQQHSGWGCDDANFRYRCEMHNGLKLVMLDRKWNLVIRHSNRERVRYFRCKDISASARFSEELFRRMAATKDYVANKHQPWGKAIVCKNFRTILSS